MLIEKYYLSYGEIGIMRGQFWFIYYFFESTRFQY